MSSDANTLPDGSYLTLKQFMMPSENGDVWAVSLSNNSATIVSATLTMFITVACVALWDVFCFFALYFSVRRSWRRYVAFVTIFNSNDPFFAFRHLVSSSITAFREAKSKTTVLWDAWYELTMATIAFIIFGGTFVAGIIGPSYLELGNMAPVRPSMVFYPAVVAGNELAGLRRYRILSPFTLHALGSVQGGHDGSDSTVKVTSSPLAPTSPSQQNVEVGYEFKLTGVDFSLQGFSHLEVQVKGSCRTEYGWYAAEETEETEDPVEVYYLWNIRDDSTMLRVSHSRTDLAVSPRASFQMHPDAEAQYLKDGNISYAMAVNTAFHPSYTDGSDPWYLTEPNTTTDGQRRIAPRRPVLSCWEQNAWIFEGQEIGSFSKLNESMAGRLPPALYQVLSAWFMLPTVYSTGNSAGNVALLSSTTGTNGRIDAEESSIFRDMRYLVRGANNVARDAFTKTILFQNRGNYPNIFMPEGSTEPAEGAASIVVSSPQFRTFDLAGVIAVSCILVFFFGLASLCSWWVASHRNHQRDITDDINNLTPPAKKAEDEEEGPATTPNGDDGIAKEIGVASKEAGTTKQTTAATVRPLSASTTVGNGRPATNGDAQSQLQAKKSGSKMLGFGVLKVIDPVDLLHCALGNPGCPINKDKDIDEDDDVELTFCDKECKGHLRLVHKEKAGERREEV